MKTFRLGALVVLVSAIFISVDNVGASGRSSLSIREDVVSAIKNRGDLGAHEISIDARRGRVVLTGRVSSEQDSEIIEQITRNTRGVTSVRNYITVVDTGADTGFFAGGRVDQLSREVKAAFNSDPRLTNYELNISSAGGVVTVLGETATEEERALITKLARGTEGVKDVVNLVRVMSGPTDSEVANRIISALQQNPEINASGLQVDVQDGVAVLRGERESFRDIDKILAVTLMVDGVKDVRSEIQLRGKPYMETYKFKG